LPWIGIGFVQVLCKLANARARSKLSGKALETRIQANRATAGYRSFFVVFILYPLLSRTTFPYLQLPVTGQ
jgi:Na+-transporting NADH:ubiquinone oxidoreductase subunit NqrB